MQNQFINIYQTISTIPTYQTNPMYGYVYIIENENYVKIGISLNPKNRLLSLNQSNSGGSYIKRIAISGPMSIPFVIERLLHQQFQKYRKNGEWFEIPFDTAAEALKKLLFSQDFAHANFIREQFMLKNNQHINIERLKNEDNE